MNKRLNDLINNIQLLDTNISVKTQQLLDNLTKPKGSLGELEELAKKIAVITGVEKPRITKKFVFVVAADHDVVEENVSLYPQEVTYQMVLNFLNGGAAINVFSKHVSCEVIVVDAGVKKNFEIKENKNFKIKKVNNGAKNFTKEPALTKNEVEKLLINGVELIEELVRNNHREKNENFLVCIGEMGIGNTTVASALTSFICGKPAEEVVGRGTGIDDERLKNKIRVVEKAIEMHKPSIYDPIDILSKIGGCEIACMTGIILGCAYYRIPIILDGFISTSAALVASCFSCRTIPYMFAGHLSLEPGHKIQLEFLGLKPILSLDMRLGEGTGAVLASSIVELSCKVLNEMATFDSASVSREI
jgi:nicotinate-nucleotide--dimethylbenzimidazole phosphoribosyltransferase